MQTGSIWVEGKRRYSRKVIGLAWQRGLRGTPIQLFFGMDAVSGYCDIKVLGRLFFGLDGGLRNLRKKLGFP